MAQPAPTPQAQQDHLISLLGGSVVEHSDVLMDYIEAGQDEVNQALRGLKPRQAPDASTRAVLEALSQQNPYEGVAYRAMHVLPSGAEVLRHIGAHVVDEGLQSASTTCAHAQDDWMDWSRNLNGRSGQGLVPTVLVLGADVPKANLASNFLADHVVVPPFVGLVVRDWRQDESGQLWCYLTAASAHNQEPARSPFSGQSRDSAELRQMRTDCFGNPAGFCFADAANSTP